MHAWRSIKYGAAVPSFARITCVNEELGAAVGFKLGRDAKFLSNKMLHMDISCPRGGAAPDSVIRLVTQLRDIFSAYRASQKGYECVESAKILISLAVPIIQCAEGGGHITPGQLALIIIISLAVPSAPNCMQV